MSHRKKRMKVSERLILRLRADFPDLPIPENAKPKRTRAGWGLKAAGAWSWYIGSSVGGFDTMKETVGAEELSVYEHLGAFNVSVEKSKGGTS